MTATLEQAAHFVAASKAIEDLFTLRLSFSDLPQRAFATAVHRFYNEIHVPSDHPFRDEKGKITSFAELKGRFGPIQSGSFRNVPWATIYGRVRRFDKFIDNPPQFKVGDRVKIVRTLVPRYYGQTRLQFAHGWVEDMTTQHGQEGEVSGVWHMGVAVTDSYYVYPAHCLALVTD